MQLFTHVFLNFLPEFSKNKNKWADFRKLDDEPSFLVRAKPSTRFQNVSCIDLISVPLQQWPVQAVLPVLWNQV